MNRERSRPVFDPPQGDRHGRWTKPTPTSIRREQAQKQEQVQKREQVQKQIRTQPNAKEKKQARERSREGLVRDAEAQQRRWQGLDRKLLQNHPQPWLPPPEDDD